jgi:hypothetical protein
VLAIIDELERQLDAAQEVLAKASLRLVKPSREQLAAMRRVEIPVSPDAYLLAVLRAAYRDIESAWSQLAGVGPGALAKLARAFRAGEFPAIALHIGDSLTVNQVTGQPRKVEPAGTKAGADGN